MNNNFRTLILGLIALASSAHGRTLPQILQAGLTYDPTIAEARANERVANSRLSQAEAARWPVVSATGGQRLATTDSDASKSYTPTLQARWTVYDFGQQSATIKREDIATSYSSYKTEESAEELIYELAGYYLEALQAKMSLAIANESLKRHQEVVEQLKIIVEYDPGRRSELTQAKARLLNSREDITNYSRTLDLILIRMARYIQPKVTRDELADPFSQLNADKLVAQFGITEDDLRRHPSYIAQQKEMARIEADLTATERSRWPTIDLISQVDEDESAVYLNMNVDLFNMAKSPSIKEKEYEKQAAQARLDSVLRNLNERGRLAELKMREDQLRIKLAESEIKELKQVAQDYEDQFFIAERSLLDVLNAYRELSGMEQIKAQATYDLMTAKLDYLSSVGGLRNWAGIDKEGASLEGGLVVAANKEGNDEETAKKFSKQDNANNTGAEENQGTLLSDVENGNDTAVSDDEFVADEAVIGDSNDEASAEVAAVTPLSASDMPTLHADIDNAATTVSESEKMLTDSTKTATATEVASIKPLSAEIPTLQANIDEVVTTTTATASGVSETVVTETLSEDVTAQKQTATAAVETATDSANSQSTPQALPTLQADLDVIETPAAVETVTETTPTEMPVVEAQVSDNINTAITTKTTAVVDGSDDTVASITTQTEEAGKDKVTITESTSTSGLKITKAIIEPVRGTTLKKVQTTTESTPISTTAAQQTLDIIETTTTTQPVTRAVVTSEVVEAVELTTTQLSNQKATDTRLTTVEMDDTAVTSVETQQTTADSAVKETVSPVETSATADTELAITPTPTKKKTLPLIKDVRVSGQAVIIRPVKD